MCGMFRKDKKGSRPHKTAVYSASVGAYGHVDASRDCTAACRGLHHNQRCLPDGVMGRGLVAAGQEWCGGGGTSLPQALPGAISR